MRSQDGTATDTSLISLLLAAGADPNRKQYGAPVWWRMINNQPECLPMLVYFLTHGANVSLRNNDGESAIVEAARRDWAAFPMLLKHGVAWKNERLIDQTLYQALEKSIEHWRAMAANEGRELYVPKSEAAAWEAMQAARAADKK